MSKITKGNCLCGIIKLEGHDDPKIDICHCEQCRRWHGGPALGIQFSGGVTITNGEDNLAWYASSGWAQRGFCKICGSTLFYRLKAEPDGLYAQAGSFRLAEGHSIHEHIFVDKKPDYYAFKDDAPRFTAAEMLTRFQEQNND